MKRYGEKNKYWNDLFHSFLKQQEIVQTQAPQDLAKNQDVQQLEIALSDLEVNLNAVIDEQDYMKMRERAHRNSKRFDRMNVKQYLLQWKKKKKISVSEFEFGNLFRFTLIIFQIANESTNTRVIWWSAFEIFLIFASTIFQVWYIRRLFEVKRTV